MINNQVDEHTRKLLLLEEEKSEKLINYWRLSLSFYFYFITYVISSEIPAKSIQALTIGATFYLSFSVFMLFWLRAGKYTPILKYLNIVVDIALISWVIWTFGTYRAFKNQAFLLYFMWIALGSMRFSFRLTVFAGALCIFSYSLILGHALYIGSIEMGTITDEYTTPKVSMLNQFVKVTYLALVTIGLSFGSKAYMKLARKARKQERDAEMQRMRAQKLESIGFLAGGLAHDFNNILAVINNNLHIINASLGDPVKVAEKVEAAEAATLKATNLTRQLLTFSKGGAPAMKTMPVQKTLEEAVKLSLTGSSLKCEMAPPPPDLHMVSMDSGQIHQVLNNLLINADQASPPGSTIRIETANQNVGPNTSLPLAAGEYIRISISDQGQGISSEHLTKIFDPYFTTKETGTGLGLATAYSIIKRHGGHISVESQPGMGATFHTYLPASTEPYIEEQALHETPTVDNMRILIMDDEEEFLKSSKEALVLSGHDVAFARDGKEAVDIYQNAMNSPRPFDIIIMDLTIPGGMGGVEAITHIKDIDPHARVIVASGYSNDPVMANHMSYGFSGILPKPFTMDQLNREIIKITSA